MTAKEKKVFIARAVAWAIFAAVGPCAFIAWRFGIFNSADHVSLSGWGIIAIVILAAFAFVLTRYVKALFPRWSMAKQVVGGFAKVIIPLGILFMALWSIRSSIDYFIQALGATIICEIPAIVINPFPKLIDERTQGKMEGLIDYALDRIEERKEKGRKKDEQ